MATRTKPCTKQQFNSETWPKSGPVTGCSGLGKGERSSDVAEHKQSSTPGERRQVNTPKRRRWGPIKARKHARCKGDRQFIFSRPRHTNCNSNRLKLWDVYNSPHNQNVLVILFTLHQLLPHECCCNLLWSCICLSSQTKPVGPNYHTAREIVLHEVILIILRCRVLFPQLCVSDHVLLLGTMRGVGVGAAEAADVGVLLRAWWFCRAAICCHLKEHAASANEASQQAGPVLCQVSKANYPSCCTAAGPNDIAHG